MEIRIKIDVENPDEVLKAHKGSIMGFVVDMVLTKEKKKRRVEKAVCQQILDVMKEELPAKLEEECVRAKVSFEIVDEAKALNPDVASPENEDVIGQDEDSEYLY